MAKMRLPALQEAIDSKRQMIATANFILQSTQFRIHDDDDDGRINFNVAYSPKTARTRNRYSYVAGVVVMMSDLRLAIVGSNPGHGIAGFFLR